MPARPRAECDEGGDEERIPVTPWHAYEGTPPAPVAVNCNANIGAWMRENIMYFVDNMEQMAQVWQAYHDNIRGIHPNVGPPAIRKFWSRRAQMANERKKLGDMAEELSWCFRYLKALHTRRNAFRGHLNLQLRSNFLFYLCLGALCDARCLNRGDVFMHANENIATVTCKREIVEEVGYCAGLSDEEKSSKYVAYLYLYAPGIYNDMRKVEFVKLPSHFVNLLRRMYGERFHLPPPIFRALLSRYVLFLALLIWRPALYDEVFRAQWDNYDFIFDLNQTQPSALDTDLLNTTLSQYSHHVMNSPPNNPMNDERAVCSTPRTWQNNWPGISLEDVTEALPPTDQLFEDLVAFDMYEDCINCKETQQDYWSRMMQFTRTTTRRQF